MSNRPDLIGVRHFPTPLNERGISRGWLRTGIDRDASEPLATKAAATLDRYGVKRLVSSDLPRSAESASLLADKMDREPEVESTRRLRTWDTGDKVAGKPEKETIPLREKYIKNSEIEMPGGESWDDFTERYSRELERQRGKPGTAFVFHGHHVLATPAILTDRKVDPKKLASLDEDFPNGAVYGFWNDGRVERLDKDDGSAR